MKDKYFAYGKNIKQCWSTIPPISTRRTITSHLKSLNSKKATTNDEGKSGPGLRQAQKGGRVKPNNGIPTLQF